MQATVATLLLITSTVILTCIVVDYAVSIVQATLQTDNIPQLEMLKNIQNSMLNQTDNVFTQYSNQTMSQPQTSPTPIP